MSVSELARKEKRRKERKKTYGRCDTRDADNYTHEEDTQRLVTEAETLHVIHII
jgi:hypothetical protein